MKSRNSWSPFSLVLTAAVAASSAAVAPIAAAQGAAPAAAAAPAAPAVTLKVGDPAPPLQVGKWLKGEPVKELEKGKVYVMEFWATWCGPCIASIPHVTKLQAQHKDKGVVVIGVDVMERDPDAPEAFVKKMGAKMDYRVVGDDTSGGPGGGKMADTWLKAAGRNGIPCSFLVDRQGKIAWIGHPMQMDRPLAMLAEDKFDPAEHAKFEEKLESLFKEFGEARQAKDHDKALGVLDQVTTLNPGMAPMLGSARMAVLMAKGDYAAVNKLAAAVAEDKEAAGDTMRLASTAQALLTAPDPAKVDAAVAVKLAAKAYEANGSEGWQYQQLLARAHAANKQYDKAAELQAKAVEGAPAQIREREEKSLAEYKEKAAAPK